MAKRLLADGIDPGQQKKIEAITKATAGANTFGVIADELLTKKRKEGKATRTMSKVSWLLDFARVSLDKRPIAEITAPEVLAVLRGIEGRGHHETAKRARSTIGEVFRYAIATSRR